MTTDLADVTGQQASAEAGITAHGAAELRGLLGVPQSPLFEGRFGRMFRNLPFVPLPRDALIELGDAMAEQAEAGTSESSPQNNPKIPAAYTYLGQFIDHDITFDPVSQLQRLNDPDALIDFRTPRYDLDCVYGRGPADEPFLYEWTDTTFRGVKLLAGHNPQTDPGDGTALARQDLPRNEQGRALIGDPRNDENIIVSQLQLAFIKFHDRLVDHVRDHLHLAGKELFEATRKRVTWHYQWLVVHDFLKRVAGAAVVGDILKNEGAPGGPTVDLKFFSWQNQPFMPVEFSGAAYRFGHSMIRPEYDLNDDIEDIPIFSAEAHPDPLSHLGGFRRLPLDWTIDWSKFVSIDGSHPQLSRRINTLLAPPLFKLPAGVDTGRHALPVLNLRRGKALQLPTGQAVAGAMSVTPLTTAELELGKFHLTAQHQTALEQNTPLWYYVLKEAEHQHNGEQLGDVGGRIVAEVLIGLLKGDPQSYLNMQPTWKPHGVPAAHAGDFTLSDMLKFATM